MVEVMRGVLRGDNIVDRLVTVADTDPWANLTLDAERAEDDLANNIFCGTGPGGGVDPSCGKDDAGAELGRSKTDIKDVMEGATVKTIDHDTGEEIIGTKVSTAEGIEIHTA